MTQLVVNEYHRDSVMLVFINFKHGNTVIIMIYRADAPKGEAKDFIEPLLLACESKVVKQIEPALDAIHVCFYLINMF